MGSLKLHLGTSYPYRSLGRQHLLIYHHPIGQCTGDAEYQGKRPTLFFLDYQNVIYILKRLGKTDQTI